MIGQPFADTIYKLAVKAANGDMISNLSVEVLVDRDDLDTVSGKYIRRLDNNRHTSGTEMETRTLWSTAKDQRGHGTNNNPGEVNHNAPLIANRSKQKHCWAEQKPPGTCPNLTGYIPK